MVDKLSLPSDSNDKNGKRLAIIVSLLIFILGAIVGYVFKPYSGKGEDVPQSMVLLVKNEYSILYNGQTKNPVWVEENIVKDPISFIDVNLNSSLPQVMQASLSDYQNSGFEVGNLLTSLGNETFYMPATSPQVAQFNQGYWQKLDKYVRTLLGIYQIFRVVTVTGPLYLPNEDVENRRYVSYQVIGKNNIAVPTHFFKVIYLPPDIALEPEVYLIPNKSISPDVALESFKINFEKLEEISGISFHKNSNVYFMRPIGGPL